MKIYEMLSNGNKNYDPYGEKKRNLNREILLMKDDFRGMVLNSKDKILMGLRLAISGNIIDFGAKDGVMREEILKNIERVMDFMPDNKTFEKFKRDVEKAKKILYIGDNAGEIVFDKIFMEFLPLEKVVFVVRGGPVINDVTYHDAEMVGLTKMVKVIDTGAKMPGVIPIRSSKNFLKEYEESDLVISKGQGNFETLEDEEKNIYFLFQVKCPVIARYLNFPLNSFIFYNF